MKTKKELAKKAKVAPKKKDIAKVRTVSSVRKVIKKPARSATRSVAGGTKVATTSKLKRFVKKSKTIAAPRFSYEKMLTESSLAKLGRKEIKLNPKRVTYILLSLILGILSAGFVLGLLEMVYLKNSFRMGITPLTHQFLGVHMFLLPIVYFFFFGAGIFLGTWLGFWGWRVVYVEHRHRMFRKS